MSTRPFRYHALKRTPPLVVVLGIVGLVALKSAEPRFLSDDPLAVEPETQDASGAESWDIDLFYDLAYNLFVTEGREAADIRALNVNSIDEVPDSSWFTNRIGVRPLTLGELTRGPNDGPAPDPSKWVIIREKSSGFAPGFTALDANGETWFVSLDAPSNPEGATGALMVATRIFWALGYNQVEYFLTEIHRDRLEIDEGATIRRPNGQRTPMTQDDVSATLERGWRSPSGGYRAAAGRLLPGRVLGGFYYQGTRPDDPNDVVPHEHRRELRALRVFGAWTNLTDMKGGNTLDTLITQGGRGIVRHYLQDVGSTFGVGAQGPHDWNEGWEFLWDEPPTVRRLWSLGFALSPWQTARYERHRSIGRFEGDSFDPETWKPRAPTAAYNEMRDDDAFWAARRVMAFTDEMIHTIVGAAEFSDQLAADYLAEVLIKRRDKIGQTYLPKINPVVDPVLDTAGVLTFHNAAVDHNVATPPAAYNGVWYSFDNATGDSTSLGETTAETARLTPPSTLSVTPDSFIRIDISARHPDHESWIQPVTAFFRRQSDGWSLVGFDRLPPQQ